MSMQFRKQGFVPVSCKAWQSVDTVWYDNSSTAYLLVRQTNMRTSTTLEQLSGSALSVSVISQTHTPTSAAIVSNTADAPCAGYGVVIWYKPLLRHLHQNLVVAGAHGFDCSSHL